MHRLHRAVAATAVLGASSTIHSLTSFTAECSPSPSPVVNVDIPSDVSHITDNANIKLVPRLANFITRHGHRTPLALLPAESMQDMAEAFGPCTNPWTFVDEQCGLGALTRYGERQLMESGSWLRSLFVKDGDASSGPLPPSPSSSSSSSLPSYALLDGEYNSSQVLVRSTGSPRAILSAKRLLVGLFPGLQSIMQQEREQHLMKQAEAEAAAAAAAARMAEKAEASDEEGSTSAGVDRKKQANAGLGGQTGREKFIAGEDGYLHQQLVIKHPSEECMYPKYAYCKRLHELFLQHKAEAKFQSYLQAEHMQSMKSKFVEVLTRALHTQEGAALEDNDNTKHLNHFDTRSWILLADMMKCRYQADTPIALPEGVTKAMLETANEAAFVSFVSILNGGMGSGNKDSELISRESDEAGEGPNTETLRVSIGPMVGEIVGRIERRVQLLEGRLQKHDTTSRVDAEGKEVYRGDGEGSDDIRMAIYSGHDTTIIPMLTTLGYTPKQWPPFASNILVELLENVNYNTSFSSSSVDNMRNRWFVRLTVNNDPSSSVVYRLEDQLERMRRYVPADLQHECKRQSTHKLQRWRW